ncbi:class I glutamine amidotransferase-like protein [Dacryopinax primogenitus]|uniref:Class I glutamine amidotransferase-like protein n=1 Tax=Dacryopinax primogenitus (strain DJM 731) TaxID=1858805 RepID=M5G8L2_DACPD|nr:class I glutamine amidotransferase-like protein [Dacryopinax primogenitus]EJU04515.1 class I glutamine amidotransferase-like protein [Dacryopinax primogenitus]
MAHVLFLLSSQGHDPTELFIPALHFLKCGFSLTFATNDGEPAQADQKLLERGSFGRVWGASEEGRMAYEQILQLEAFQKPDSWGSERFNVLDYGTPPSQTSLWADAIILPGGHDKPIRAFLESKTLQAHLRTFWPFLSRSSSDRPRVIGAICHGSLALAFTELPSGQSVLRGVCSATLPRWMERAAWWGSQFWGLGGYYRTYGPEGRWCADDIVASGAKYVQGPLSTSPFVCVDPEWRYVSARFPGDAKLFAQKVEEEIRLAMGER